MSSGISLDWACIDWGDPEGGVIRILPFTPLVKFSESIQDWDGLALMVSSEDPLLWIDQEQEEMKSPNIVRDAMIAQMGHSGKMVKEMSLLSRETIGCFPDPIPFSMYNFAKSNRKPIWFLEPDLDDEEWVEITLEGVGERTNLRNLVRSIGSVRRMMRIAKSIATETTPDGDDAEYHIAASLSAAWWMVESAHLSENLHHKINHRIASRMRGALSSLRNQLNEQIDDEEAVVLLVPVPQVRIRGVLDALNELPDAENMKQEEE